MTEHKNCSQCGQYLLTTQFNIKWKDKQLRVQRVSKEIFRIVFGNVIRITAVLYIERRIHRNDKQFDWA